MIQPNEHLLDVYRVTEDMSERAGFVSLDRNERVTPFPEQVFRDMLATIKPADLSSYPDPSPVYRRLSNQTGLAIEHLQVTNGSDAALRMIFQTYVQSGDTVVFPEPSYAMCGIYTNIFQASAHTVNYDAELSLDIGELIRQLQHGPRLLFVANPDQPTSSVLREDSLRRLAKIALEVGTLFVIDEAYYPFYPHTAMGLVSEFDNVIVTRSFSKAAGLAGLRLGYLVAHPDIVNNLQHVRGAHEVNSAAVSIGAYILDHPEIVEGYLAEVQAGRDVLATAARSLGVGFPYSQTNFQLLRIPGFTDTATIVAELKSKGYLVKGNFTSLALRDCIRVTVGPPELMVSFVGCLREVIDQL